MTAPKRQKRFVVRLGARPYHYTMPLTAIDKGRLAFRVELRGSPELADQLGKGVPIVIEAPEVASGVTIVAEVEDGTGFWKTISVEGKEDR